jgi:hypothetical protein
MIKKVSQTITSESTFAIGKGWMETDCNNVMKMAGCCRCWIIGEEALGQFRGVTYSTVLCNVQSV